MKRIQTYLLYIFIFILTHSYHFIHAQVFDPLKACVIDANGECVPNTVLSAMPFLRIIPDARGGAMGDAGIVTSPDPNSIHYNASNLAFVEKDATFSATYTPWLRQLNLNDIYLAYISGYKKIDDLQAVGAALRFFSLGDIRFTDEQGAEIGAGRPRELEFAITYARKLSDNFAMGLTGKYVYSNLATGQEIQGTEIQSATSFAADFSMTYRRSNNITPYGGEFAVGLAMTNIGAKVSYTRDNVRDYLPANLGIGTALTMNLDEFNKLTFALDFNKLMVPTPISPTILTPDGNVVQNPNWDSNGTGIPDYREKPLFTSIFQSFYDAPGGFSEELREVSVSVGAEYWYDNQFAVRAGYYYEHPQKGDRNYITVGFGLKYNVFGFDLSYLVPTTNRRNPLDNTLRFSVNFDFEALK